MTDDFSQDLTAAAVERDLSRRQLFAQAAHVGLWASAVATLSGALAESAIAQEATPAAQAEVDALLALSAKLCGGGTFDSDRTTTFVQLISGNPALRLGLNQLLAAPPEEGQPLPGAEAGLTAQVILLYWYVGEYAKAPVPDRATAYYSLTAWQAMYTPPWAVCKAFGAWAEPPRTESLVPQTPAPSPQPRA